MENHAIVREVVGSYVERMEGMRLCGSAASAEEALEHIAAVRPDVVVVDLSLGGMDGLELITELVAREPDLACIVLSGHDDPSYRERALAAGARAYVLKDDPAQLEHAIRSL